MPIAFLLTLPAPIYTDNIIAPAKSDEAVKSTLKLAVDSPSVILTVTQTSVVVPGESKNDREKRLAATAKRAALAKEAIQVSTANDPADFKALYHAAGEAFGVSPFDLEAIHQKESGKSGSTKRANPSGATGPMQFKLATFRAHAIDGNGDGVKSVYSVVDSVYSAAKYLHDSGYSLDRKRAILSYNPSISYYYDVTTIAKKLGYAG